jgi:membrane carboxypeptidase/penicillin-binding protein
LELTSAIAVFANRGKMIKPFAGQVDDSAGRIVLERKTRQKTAMSRTVRQS